MGAHKVDIGYYDLRRDDQLKIADDATWVPYRICQELFFRVRLTSRYCNICKRAFCEGEHGSFARRGPGVCVQCHLPAQRL
jgi:hypothetical protein